MKLLSNISFILSTVCAVMVASVSEVPNWWDITKPWAIAFFVFVAIYIVSNNIDEIRRYTYPVLVCILAWGYNHKIIYGKFAKMSYIMYQKYNSNYYKLYTKIQNLYDKVVFTEV